MFISISLEKYNPIIMLFIQNVAGMRTNPYEKKRKKKAYLCQNVSKYTKKKKGICIIYFIHSAYTTHMLQPIWIDGTQIMQKWRTHIIFVQLHSEHLMHSVSIEWIHACVALVIFITFLNLVKCLIYQKNGENVYVVNELD